jgi:hypothetical protein
MRVNQGDEASTQHYQGDILRLTKLGGVTIKAGHKK